MITRTFVAALLIGCAAPALAASAQPQVTHQQVSGHGLTLRLGSERIAIDLEGAGIVHVQALPAGVTDTHTLVLDPDAKPADFAGARVHRDGNNVRLSSDRLNAIWHRVDKMLEITDAHHHRLLQLDLAALADDHISIEHARGDTLYGIGGYTTHQSVKAGLVRTGKQIAKAGEQGHAGAPFVWSTAGYGVLVDSDGARFDLAAHTITVSDLSKPSLDVYLLVGKPRQLFAALADLSGHAPMFPKWSMGFINTQWGIDEKELLDIVATYRRKHIPIDGFILDFDWKAWGKDHYGEFRWNRQKFPDGPDGKLKAMMAHRGIHLGGIMKPRIHLNTVQGRYATKHHLWFAGEKAETDYFSHQPVKEIDFDKPASRKWFGHAAMKYAFDEGIVGWWNDEADTTDSNTQFLNMERSLYTAQRDATDVRVWSINRDFWLGAQRYAYGLWSGDIDTGFKVMARQRTRMLSAIGVGEMWWSMDGGGFNGHPSDENYARWIEFAAFVPIFRVHGTQGEKRQPWVYGPVAEKAATHAIRLRYRLLPYIYSFAHHGTVAGVGLVRPLSFGWPGDRQVRNDVDAWMFGRWLLVSPVMREGATRKRIYLPAGTWTDWTSGKVYRGGQTITIPVDSRSWADIPLFIRAGAIIPTQPVLDYVGQRPIKTVTVELFPADHPTHFDYYDDDGDTYAYTHGAFFRQRLSLMREGNEVRVAVEAPAGSYRPALKSWLLKIHDMNAANVRVDGHVLPRAASVDALEHGDGEGWARGHDRYGEVTFVRIAAGVARKVTLRAAR